MVKTKKNGGPKSHSTFIPIVPLGSAETVTSEDAFWFKSIANATENDFPLIVKLQAVWLRGHADNVVTKHTVFRVPLRAHAIRICPIKKDKSSAPFSLRATFLGY